MISVQIGIVNSSFHVCLGELQQVALVTLLCCRNSYEIPEEMLELILKCDGLNTS